MQVLSLLQFRQEVPNLTKLGITIIQLWDQELPLELISVRPLNLPLLVELELDLVHLKLKLNNKHQSNKLHTLPLLMLLQLLMKM